MKKLKLIQCGVGGFGNKWLKEHTVHSPDFEIAAIVDIMPANLEEAGESCRISKERRFTSLEAALDRIGADAVLTVTPPAIHPEHARMAFAWGLHVMTEKPLASTIQEAREMIGFSKKSDRQLVVSQQYRYKPHLIETKKQFVSGAIGEFGHGHLDFYIPADFTGTFREKMKFPLLLDMAIHHVDLIRAITGRDVVKVAAQSFHPPWSWYGHDAGLKMLLELEGGLPFSYSGDWSALGRSTSWDGSWRIQGSKGSLHLENDRLFLAKSGRWSKDESVEEVPIAPAREAQSETLARFAEAIRTGIPAETSGSDNIRSLAVVLGAMRSAQESRTVTLEEMLHG